MTHTTSGMAATYPYIFARARERGRDSRISPFAEAQQAFRDNAPADTIERYDFNPVRGREAEERMKAAIEAGNNGAYLVYRDDELIRVWYRIGALRAQVDRLEQLQTWAEQYHNNAGHQQGRKVS